MKQQQVTVSRKIGRNKGRPRLWLEGNILLAAGFTVGSHYRVVFDDNGMTLFKDAEGRKVSGKGEKPIIDILGRTIEQAFPSLPESVRVTALSNMIIVEG